MNISILFASLSGNTEKICVRAAKILTEKGHSPLLIDVTDKEASILEGGDLFLIATSTWGAGAINDQFKKFYDSFINTNLKDKRFILIGLGDIDYGEYYFCKAIDLVADAVKKNGGNIIGEVRKIDGDPDLITDQTLTEWLQLESL